MLCVKVRLYINRWKARRRMSKILKKYGLRFQQAAIERQLNIDAVWNSHNQDKIDDYIACIDFRLYFISRKLSKTTVDKIERYKKKHYSKRDFEKICTLSKIVYRSDINKIDAALNNLIEGDRRRWTLLK